MRTARLTTTLVVLGAAMLSGCGTTPENAATRDGGKPVTARSIAFIASSHLPQPVTEAHSGTDFDGRGTRSTGTELDVKPAAGNPIPRLTIAVIEGSAPDELTQCAESPDDCIKTRGVTLRWQQETPEEDPGGVSVYATKGDTVIAMFQSGESILGDPRQQDLQISVTTMINIATDPRLNATTTASAVDAGKHLPYWHGPDSSPAGPRVSEPPSP